MSKNILLVTSAIKPINIMKLSSIQDRLSQTLEKLIQISKMNLFDEIHLVDSTGFKFELNVIHSLGAKIFAHSFFQNDDLVSKYGYGYGEALIYQKFYNIYNGSDSSIYKISGRYFITNLPEIISLSNNIDNLFYTFYPRYFQYRNYVHTAFFKMKFSDLSSCSEFCLKYLEEKPNRPLEEAMYFWQNSVYGSRKSWIKLPSPQYQGISGLKNTKLSNYSFPYSFFRRFDFLPIMSFYY